jgi:peroxiredoxin
MSTSRIFLIAIVLFTVSCGNIADDLIPSGEDKRSIVTTGVTGSDVGQNGPDFTVYDSLGNSVTLSTETASADGVVLYFTMWCPVCSSHQDHMLETVIPDYPNVKFFLVDYVHDSVEVTRDTEVSNGLATTAFTTLADSSRVVAGLYGGTMATTVVIDADGVVLMNEDYKDGAKLAETLADL